MPRHPIVYTPCLHPPPAPGPQRLPMGRILRGSVTSRVVTKENGGRGDSGVELAAAGMTWVERCGALPRVCPAGVRHRLQLQGSSTLPWECGGVGARPATHGMGGR